MELMDCIASRHSVRSFLPDAVSEQDLLYCIQAARLAPSSFNTQPWKFIAVTDPALCGKVAAAVCNPILRTNMQAKDCLLYTSRCV